MLLFFIALHVDTKIGVRVRLGCCLTLTPILFCPKILKV
ncbi:hypothetical protein MEZE111188_16330 [Mesobacillus zeae]